MIGTSFVVFQACFYYGKLSNVLTFLNRVKMQRLAIKKKVKDSIRTVVTANVNVYADTMST